MHAHGHVRRRVASRFPSWESPVKKQSTLRTGFASLRRKFAPSLISRALREIFSARERTPARPPRARHSQAFLLEPIEPRLLPSAAAIDYTAAALQTSLTLSAVDATHVQLSGGSYTSASTDLSASAGELDITRATGADFLGDTIHLDLSSLQNLTTGLSVNFTGGLQSLLVQDTVQLDGAGTFGFDVKVQ